MKVLMIEHTMPESVYIQELSQELRHYAQVSVLCKSSIKEPPCEGVEWLSKLYRAGAGTIEGRFLYAKSLLDMVRIIGSGRYDVVHVHNFKSDRIEIPMYRMLRPRIKHLVCTIHNVLPHEVSQADEKLYGSFYAICDWFIVHNEATKKCLMDTFHVPEDRISITPHGAHRQYQPVPDSERTDGKVHFLNFGNIRRYKGIDFIIRAAALLDKETRSRVVLSIAGKQFPKLDATDYPAMIRELGVEDCVRFSPERVEDADLPALMAGVDVMMLPYRDIYGSGALLVAYAFEKPVIVSDIPALVEETDNGRTGISFASENPAALAEAIRTAANWTQEQRAAYRAAIHDLVENKYSWKNTAKLTYEVYKRVMEKR